MRRFMQYCYCVTHKDPISKKDFLKINSSSALDVDTPAAGHVAHV